MAKGENRSEDLIEGLSSLFPFSLPIMFGDFELLHHGSLETHPFGQRARFGLFGIIGRETILCRSDGGQGQTGMVRRRIGDERVRRAVRDGR